MSNAFAARQWATMKLFEGVSRHKGKVLISLVITTLAMSLLLVAFTLSLTAYNSVKGVSVAQEMTIFTNQGVSSERAANLKETIEKQPGITRVRLVSPDEALGLIGDTDNRPYWKRTVCGRECVHVIGKSGRCRPGIKIPAVPGRLAPHNIRVLSDTVKPDIMLVPGAFFSGRRGSRVSFLKILSHKCRSFLLADMRIRLRMAPLCKIPPQRFGVTGGGVSPECQRADKRAREDKQRETKF